MFENQTFDAPQFGTVEAVIERHQNRFEPELRFFLRLLDVNVRRLLAFVGVEEKPFTVDAKHYWHLKSLADLSGTSQQKEVDDVPLAIKTLSEMYLATRSEAFTEWVEKQTDEELELLF